MVILDNIEVIILLHDGYPVKSDLHNALKQQVEESIGGMELGVKYSLEDMCDKDFWESLSMHDHRIAGRCMASWVKTGLIPLNMTGCVHKRRYYK